MSRPGDDGAILYEGRAPDGRRLKVVLLPPGLADPGGTVWVKTAMWRDEGGS